jgi:hypothetical protein
MGSFAVFFRPKKRLSKLDVGLSIFRQGPCQIPSIIKNIKVFILIFFRFLKIQK